MKRESHGERKAHPQLPGCLSQLLTQPLTFVYGTMLGTDKQVVKGKGYVFLQPELQGLSQPLTATVKTETPTHWLVMRKHPHSRVPGPLQQQRQGLGSCSPSFRVG